MLPCGQKYPDGQIFSLLLGMADPSGQKKPAWHTMSGVERPKVVHAKPALQRLGA
jgi:hypothetical protein